MKRDYKMTNLITSSGIIRNREKPRTGIVSMNSLAEWMHDELHEGIDLTYEEYVEELLSQGIEQDTDAFYKATDCYECDNRTMLIGDAWVKNADGKYVIDKTKTYAATYSSSSGNIAVEWSKHTTLCHHTSPCYVMSDGSGPCGDLDTEGDSVLAYTLPSEYFNGKE